MKNLQEYESFQLSADKIQEKMEYSIENSNSSAIDYRNLIATKRISNWFIYKSILACFCNVILNTIYLCQYFKLTSSH